MNPARALLESSWWASTSAHDASDMNSHATLHIEAEPYPFELTPAAAALVIIDMQRDFLEPGGFGEMLGNDVAQLRRTIDPNRELLGAWRKHGLLVLHTREGHRPDLADLPESKRTRGRGTTRIGDRGPMGRIVRTVGTGDPFIPENAERLSRMGWIGVAAHLVMLPLGGVAMWLMQLVEDTPAAEDIKFDLDFGLDFSGILLILILGLAAVGLVNAMTIAALGRVREIGVLRALGTSRRQLRQALLVEGLLTGGLAALVAVLLGVPLGILIVHGMNSVAGVAAPYVPPWHAIIAAPLAALAVGALSAWVPGSRMARIEPARAVRFE